MLKKSILSFALFLFFHSFLLSQRPPIKFGKISPEEFEQDVCPIDSSASAMVTCNYGHFRGRDFSYMQVRRVKIIKKEGTNYGSIVTYGGETAKVRGFTYNLENGKIEKTKLHRNSVFRERVTDDYYRYRIAMPNVKEGSIIDFEFRYTGMPNSWYFQEDIPVLHSELRIDPSQYVDFRKNAFGFEPLTKTSPNHMIAKNMPAFKDEPYISSRENYISKIEFDILKVSFPGHYKSFTTDWDALRKQLNEDDYFGLILRKSTNYLSDIAEQINLELGEDATDLEKTKAAYQAVKTVKWNGKTALKPEKNMLSSVLKDGTGSSAEINFMLLHLLEELEIKAYPVIMSTRKNGALNPFFPSLEKLNYVIACASVDGQHHLMDASEELMPFGLLPKRCLNGQGRILTDQALKLIDLKPGGTDNSAVMYNLQLDAQGNLSGTRDFQANEFAAFEFRDNFRDSNNKESFIKKLEDQNSNLDITELNIENLDQLQEILTANFELELRNQITKIDSLAFLNPFCLEKLNENPFKVKERKYPVDFAFNKEQNVVIRILLPDGVSVSELPESKNIVLPGNAAMGKLVYQASGNNLMVHYVLKINKTLFLPEEYDYIKIFFDEIITKQKEPIVLVFNN